MRGMAELLHRVVWGPWTLVLFLGVGLVYTIRFGGFQIFGIRTWWRETVGTISAVKSEEARSGNTGMTAETEGAERNRKETKGVTPFQAACTALAATIGTGNIVGVATALVSGGPGALFWIWVSAAIGMATAYAETWLGQEYRFRETDGHWMCGPMVYIERGLGLPGLGIVYAALAAFASLGMGSMVQSNSISQTLSYSGDISSWLSAPVITGLAALVILGGTGRIARVAERLMPLSAGVYLMFAGIVILSCAGAVPGILVKVICDAFRPGAAAGGIGGFLLGKSLRYGLSRGVFSNEAGLGSLAILHGAAENTTPRQQGMWAMFEVFFDTIVICTLTALVILCIGTQAQMPEGLNGSALAAWCFSRRLGIVGEALISSALSVFAFATIIAWYYLGRQTFRYLTGHILPEHLRLLAEKWYTFLYLAAVFTGCLGRLDTVWLFADIVNGMMAFPNLAALLWMAGEVQKPND
ncbi:MAG: amino acid carrier protein [Clostridiales bacterium]|nr:amino acid carrier protein [Clostridiales bacterium]